MSLTELLSGVFYPKDVLKKKKKKKQTGAGETKFLVSDSPGVLQLL